MSEKHSNAPEGGQEHSEDEQPVVYAVHKNGGKTTFTRRDFLAMAGIAGGAVVILGCGKQTLFVPTRTPRPTDTPQPTETPVPTPTEAPIVMSLSDCQSMLADKNGINQLSLSKDGKWLVSYGYDDETYQPRIKLWSLVDGALIMSLENTSAFDFSPDSQTLAVGKEDAMVELISLPDGNVTKSLIGNVPRVFLTKFSRDGKLLATGGDASLIRVWSIPDGELLNELEVPMSAVYTFDISPDNKLLATGGDGNNIHLWSIPDGSLVNTLEGHSGLTYEMKFSANGKRLVSVGSDSTVRLWSVPDGELVTEIVNSYQFAFSPDGTLLAACPNMQQIELIATEDGQVLNTWEGSQAVVSRLVFSPDGSKLASCGEEAEVRLWSIPDGQLLIDMEGHTEKVLALAFSPDGQKLYSGGDDKTIKVWNLNGEFAGCLIDLADTPPDVDGVTYTKTDATGQIYSYTLPCGSPIPDGAICTCNCVSGMGAPVCACVGDFCSCVGDTCSCVGDTGGTYLTYWYPN